MRLGASGAGQGFQCPTIQARGQEVLSSNVRTRNLKVLMGAVRVSSYFPSSGSVYRAQEPHRSSKLEIPLSSEHKFYRSTSCAENWFNVTTNGRNSTRHFCSCLLRLNGPKGTTVWRWPTTRLRAGHAGGVFSLFSYSVNHNLTTLDAVVPAIKSIFGFVIPTRSGCSEFGASCSSTLATASTTT